MKKILLFVSSLLIILTTTEISFAQDSNINWLSNLEEAKEVAVKENKKILLYFSGSDWCIPCMQLKKEVLAGDSFKSFVEQNLIPVVFDFPAHSKNLLPEDQQKYNEGKAEIYNKDGSFPLILILNIDGSEAGKIKGYSREGSEKYMNKLKSILDL